jgi:hypothetical protein
MGPAPAGTGLATQPRARRQNQFRNSPPSDMSAATMQYDRASRGSGRGLWI